jgi:pimeloyl-ACP methyl ester carboxylesterase
MTAPATTKNGLAYSITDLRPPWRTSGKPVVFHHGIGTNRDIWSDWLPVIAARHRVIRFDTRGFGASPIPDENHVWTLDALVEDLCEVVDVMGDGPIHLVGESIGGTVALAAALAHPARVASLTVSNTAYKGAGVGRVAGWRAEVARIGMDGWSHEMMRHRFAPGATSDAKLAWFAAEQARAKAHVILDLGDLLAGTDLTDELPQLRAPLLILSPDGSPFVPASMATELAAYVPGAELAIFPGTRHGLPFSHSREAAERLAKFLERVEGTAT